MRDGIQIFKERSSQGAKQHNFKRGLVMRIVSAPVPSFRFQNSVLFILVAKNRNKVIHKIYAYIYIHLLNVVSFSPSFQTIIKCPPS